MSERTQIFQIQRFCMHDGPGLRTVVFVKGCPLRCIWCCNPESQSALPELMHNGALCKRCGRCVDACKHNALALRESSLIFDAERCVMCGDCADACPWSARAIVGKSMTADEVLILVMRDKCYYEQSGGGITISGGEPTASGAFLIELLSKAKKAGINTAIETCGHCDRKLFQEVAELCDTILFDVKHTDADIHRQYTGVGLESLWENLHTASQLSKTVVRIPLIPGFNTYETSYRDICERLKEYPLQEVHILPYHQLGISKYSQTGRTYSGGNIPTLTDHEIEACKVYFQKVLFYPIVVHKH